MSNLSFPFFLCLFVCALGETDERSCFVDLYSYVLHLIQYLHERDAKSISKVMAHSTARTFVEPFLTYRSYIRVRIFIPLAVYLPLSLSYAMVSLPFKLPFDAKWVVSSLSSLPLSSSSPPPYQLRNPASLIPPTITITNNRPLRRFSYAAGFFTFAAFIYMGMCALGLALEAMITLLTPRFVPFFLVLLVRRSSAIAPFPSPPFLPPSPSPATSRVAQPTYDSTDHREYLDGGAARGAAAPFLSVWRGVPILAYVRPLSFFLLPYLSSLFFFHSMHLLFHMHVLARAVLDGDGRELTTTLLTQSQLAFTYFSTLQ